MSNKIRRRLDDKGEALAPAVLTNSTEDFGRRLCNALLDRGMTQSDLAREVFKEERIDSRGYAVVVGKDRISQYVRGKTKPEPKTLKKIADALGMTPEGLAPDLAATAVEQSQPDLSITMVAGRADLCLLRINRLVPLAVAMEIGSILSRFEETKK